jgi:hypothetical protein
LDVHVVFSKRARMGRVDADHIVEVLSCEVHSVKIKALVCLQLSVLKNSIM